MGKKVEIINISKTGQKQLQFVQVKVENLHRCLCIHFSVVGTEGN